MPKDTKEPKSLASAIVYAKRHPVISTLLWLFVTVVAAAWTFFLSLEEKTKFDALNGGIAKLQAFLGSTIEVNRLGYFAVAAWAAFSLGALVQLIRAKYQKKDPIVTKMVQSIADTMERQRQSSVSHEAERSFKLRTQEEQIAALTKKVEQLHPSSLTDDEKRIVEMVAVKPHDYSASGLAGILKIHPERMKYHVRRLTHEFRFLDHPSKARPYFVLTDAGRTYAVNAGYI